MPDANPATPRIGLRTVWRLVIGAAAIAVMPVATGETGTRHEWVLVLANILPWCLPWLLFLALLRRPFAATVLTALIQIGVYAANAIKLEQLGLPILPADLAALHNLWHAPTLFLRYVDVHPAFWGLLLCLLLAWFESPLAGLTTRARTLTAVIAVALITSLGARLPPWPALYGRQQLGIPVWLPADGAREAGAIAQFLHLYLTTQQELRELDQGALLAAKNWLAARPETTHPADDLPDIVVIQSESFFDPGDLVGVDTAAYAPHLDALRRQHLHGRLTVPAYGGLTTRSEFAFLTAFPLRGEPVLEYPYQALVHRVMPALPWVLREHGLATTVLHPYVRQFYQRDVAMPLLGFEHFVDESVFSAEDRHGHYIADAAMNRQIQDELGAPGHQFVFAISIENHSPWDSPRPIGDVALPALPPAMTLDERGALAMRQYLHHLARGDQALGELVDWVMQRNEPTLLLFYGDHLPAMHYVIEHLPWDDGQLAFQQTTPWLLVDNRNPPTRERIDLAASELAALLLHQAGIDTATPFAGIDRLRRARASGELDAKCVDDWQRALATASIAGDDAR